ncbi:MAG: CRISPR-associated protein Cas4 [Lachnospiraceae bacterium]|nr:CRISPR-associated protein Cas4 [Lachnospiraceae bacterium]
MTEFEYKEEDFLQLAGLQHFTFCRRQWALIHIEQQWEENVLTVKGNLFHEKVHDGYSRERRKNVIISRGMPVHSRSLGISGECDVVEFVRAEEGISLPGQEGKYILYPVEYKRGRAKITDEDRMQLTAQVICLEEMFLTEISRGYLFYGETRRRECVEITGELRAECRRLLQEMHQFYARGYTPKVKKAKKCEACSLRELCLPKLENRRNVAQYISQYMESD